MLNANTTWRRAAGVTLCAALLTTVVWAAWIPLSGWNSRKSSQDAGGSVPPLAVAEAKPAAPPSRQITHPPEVVGKHDPSRVAATSPLAIPAAPLQSVVAPRDAAKALNGDPPINVPELLMGAHTPVVDSAARALAWTAKAAARTPAVGRSIAEADAAGLAAVVLHNPSTTGGAVGFMVNRRAYTLEPGQSRRLQAGELGLLQFHRGGDFGDARHELSPGAYEFQVTNEGWALLQVSPTSAQRTE